MTTQAVSIVIPTRDRGDTILLALNSILSSQHTDYEILVVDQSEDRRTRDAVSRLTFPIQYIKSSGKGVALARNEGIYAAKHEIVGILDDDCIVNANWAIALIDAFKQDGNIGLVFGNVIASSLANDDGYIPSYERARGFLAKSIYDKNNVEGLSACMGIKRSHWKNIYGFDEMLGVGGQLRSGAESDLTIRMLLAQYFVYETPAFSVTHNGYRNEHEAAQLIDQYWFGTGAMFAKHIKQPDFRVWYVIVKLGLRWGSRKQSLVGEKLKNKAVRWLQLKAFLAGFIAGACTRVDRKKRLFLKPTN